MATTDQTKKRKFPALSDLTPEQLQRLAKAHRKRGMKQTENSEECKRLFRLSYLAGVVGKLKAKRLAKEKARKQAQRLPANENYPAQGR